MNLDGWHPDPFGTHEERLFKQGEPTPLVRDGGVGSYDDPPASLTSATAAPTTVAPPPNAGASPGAGWWQASDGKWYPPEQHPNYQPPPPPPPPPASVPPPPPPASVPPPPPTSLVLSPVLPTQAVVATDPFSPPFTQAMQASPAVMAVNQGAGSSGFVGKDRSPASVLGLSLITFGIYYLVWYHHINAEIRRHDPDIKVRPGWCVVAVLVPIANLVSAYSTAARIRQMQLDDGQTDTISPVVALLLYWILFIGYPLYVASQLREHWHGHRRALS
jgi:hypothetical protein